MREIRNLFTDPVPTGAGTWTANNPDKAGVSFADGQLLVQGYETTGNTFVYRRVQGMSAGDYVLSFISKSDSSPTFFENRVCAVTNTNYIILGVVNDAALNNGRAILRFTNPKQQDLKVLFQAPNKAASVAYERMLLCTAEDYEAMLAANVEWFSGTTYLRPGGGFPLAACIHMWITAMLWWWSHEQHRNAEYVHAAVPAVQAQCVECGERAARRWPVAVQGRWQLRAWHGACGDQIDRSGCGRCARVGLRMRRAYTTRWVEFGLSVLHAWLRLAAWRHSVRPDWLECVQDRGHDQIRPRVRRPPRRRLGHNPRLRELHGRGLAGHRNANHQGQSACRLVRATTGRRDRASVSTCAHTLTAISQWEMVA